MKVIKPTIVTDDILTSSTIAEPDTGESVWNAATNYSIGDLVIRTETHRIYENLIAGVNATTPEVAALEATPRWLDIGPTNRWAVFDGEIGSTSTKTGGFQYVFEPGEVGAVALIEIVNASSITVTLKDAPGGTVVYTSTNDELDGAGITDFFDFFFEPYQQLDRVVFTDLPQSYTSPELTIDVVATGIAEVGVIAFGPVYELGDTQYGAQLGIVDYSRKTTDDFGRTTVTRRRFSSTLEARQQFDQVALNRVFRLLAELRSTPCVWIGADYMGYETTIIYGFYLDFSIDLAFPTANYCTLRLESLT